jgi:hypothetical protein
MRALSVGAALLSLTILGRPLTAQAESTATSSNTTSLYAAGGVMRYGPHALIGLELSTARFPLAARVEGMVALRPEAELSRMFIAGLLGAVLPIRPTGIISPYLLGGVALSQSRHLGPQAGPVGGMGMRFRVGSMTPFVEARAQHRAGVLLSLGIRF